MRFVTFTDARGDRRPGVLLDDTTILDLAAAGEIPSIDYLIRSGRPGLERVDALRCSASARHVVALGAVTLLAPFQPVQLRSFSVYPDHLRNSVRATMRHQAKPLTRFFVTNFVKLPGKRFFEAPLYYKGTVTNISGPGDIVVPPYGELLDYELELAVVIGPGGRDIPRESAYDHVFGYTVYNDVSARKQLMKEVGIGGAGPAKGKDFDGSNRIGPWIVTPDEVGDPMNLAGHVRLNGNLVGQSTTAGMAHDIAAQIAYASWGETLQAGEMIGTGAMNNCCGIERWQFLKPGDALELEIDRIGTLRNRIIPAGTGVEWTYL